MSNLISLPAELTIYTVSELHPRWLARLGEADRNDAAQSLCDDHCRVDAAAVEDVDAAGVQLLLSLSNALARRERALQLVNPSPPLTRACAALGVASLLANADLTGVAA
jgi:anti-anti-sigma regulatory factor